MQTTVTLDVPCLYQPLSPVGATVGAQVTTGAVRSTLTITSVVAELPAPSRARPWTIWPAPWVDTVVGGVTNAWPDVSSFELNLTSGGELFHPALFGAGLTSLFAIVGATESMQKTISCDASLLPAVSTA